jgi:glucokinase
MDIIGIDIGGTKCAVCGAGADGLPVGEGPFPTRGVEETIAEILARIERLNPTPETVYGISCGGPLDSKTGVVLSPPNLPGWDAIPICEIIMKRFGGRAFLMNDANAGALAEWLHGAGRGVSSMVFMTFGTGLGAGVILDGRLYEGASGDAGEAGHVRLAEDGPPGYGKRGSFEGFCSGGGIAQAAKAEAVKRGGKVAFNPGRVEDIATKDVGIAAAKGDPLAVEIFARAGRKLGLGLSILIDILNPELIALGGIYPRCKELLEPSMREVLKEEALPRPLELCRIVPAQLGERIGDMAALSIAQYMGAKRD